MAVLLWEAGRREAAEKALAAAVGFSEIADLYSDHAFARAFIQRGVWVAYQASEGDERRDARNSRIIRP